MLAAEADEQDLGHGRHPLTHVFHAGHGVIAAVREATEKRSSPAGRALFGWPLTRVDNNRPEH